MWHRLWVCVVTVVVCVLLALTIPVRSDRLWVDPVSGSVKWQTVWLGVPGSIRVNQSDLERWIVAHAGSHDPEWLFVNETIRTISGRWAGCGVGQTPKIFSRFLVGDGLKRFVRNGTDAEIAKFVGAMRKGTPDEQTQAVDEAVRIVEGH
jgi:hypothetical protein